MNKINKLEAIWIDNVDLFACYGLDDLPNAIIDHYGESWESMTGESVEDVLTEYLEPTEDLTIHNWNGNNEKRTQTVAEWIIEYGRGQICSTEW